jgi:tetratricopeptide (TPR) repeat protein
VSVCCPRHQFDEIETFHWWDFEVEEDRLCISSGGRFYQPSSGGDTFTTMVWRAIPKEPTELDDYRDGLRMVPDVRSYPDGVDSIDLAEGGYTVEILDEDNPLLEEQRDEEVDDEDAGVEADKEEAEKWLKRGLEHRDLEQYEDAFACFKKGIQLNPNHPELQLMLGVWYDSGLGVPQDYAEAAVWYRKAAEQGIAAAQHGLAYLYNFGQGVPRDFTEAGRWFRKAADQGDEAARTALAAMPRPESVASASQNTPEAPPEEAGPRTVALFLTEFIPGVAKEYSFLEEAAGGGPINPGLTEFQTEVLIFGLHCLQRTVFANCGAEYRKVFMDHALSFVSAAFSSVLPDHIQKDFSASFEKHYRARQREYSAMILPLGEGSPKGTLFYEYGKRICRDAGVDNPEAVQLMMEQGWSIFKMMDRISQTL